MGKKYSEFIKWCKDNSWDVIEKDAVSLNLNGDNLYSRLGVK